MKRHRINILEIVSLALVATTVALAACVGPTSQIQFSADQARRESIGQEWIEYVDADPTMQAEDKARRHRTLETWDQQLAAAAAALGLPARGAR